MLYYVRIEQATSQPPFEKMVRCEEIIKAESLDEAQRKAEWEIGRSMPRR